MLLAIIAQFSLSFLGFRVDKNNDATPFHICSMYASFISRAK